MARETWAERKERERRRDAFRELAWEVAQHVARGDMNTVERVLLERDGFRWPAFRFGPRVSPTRCECGLMMVPIPTFSRRWGTGHTWFCSVCNLQGLVEACARVGREVE